MKTLVKKSYDTHNAAIKEETKKKRESKKKNGLKKEW